MEFYCSPGSAKDDLWADSSCAHVWFDIYVGSDSSAPFPCAFSVVPVGQLQYENDGLTGVFPDVMGFMKSFESFFELTFRWPQFTASL